MRKTAYEMRLIDCSSDVCSSYLPSRPPVRRTDQRWARGRASRPLQARQRLCRTQSEEGVSRPGTSQALSFRPVRYRSDSALPGCSGRPGLLHQDRSEEHTSELQSLMRISYAVFCLKKNKHIYRTLLDRINIHR